MKWIKDFLLVDCLAALLVTLLIYLVLLRGKPGQLSASILSFAIVSLFAFNIHFFGVHLGKARSVGLWRPMSDFLDRLQHADARKLAERTTRVAAALRSACTLIEEPPPPPPLIGELIQAVMTSQDNLCAISSKDIYLWGDPTFLYYFMLNGLKAIEGASARNPTKHFCVSHEPQDKIAFQDRESRLLAALGAGSIPTDYFVMRFLVYPDSAYSENRDSVVALLNAHWAYGIHCVPVVVEDLASHLSDQEKDSLRSLAELVGMSRSSSIPDLLLVDMAMNGGVLRPYSGVCYYNNGRPYVRRVQCCDASGQLVVQPVEMTDYFRPACLAVSLLARQIAHHPTVVWAGHSVTSAQSGVGLLK